MLTYERRNAIFKLLEKEHMVSVEALARMFYVSESTIRRDLDKISGEGTVRRTYGGAVLLENLAVEMPITVREHENTDAKQTIAQNAAKLIRGGATIILDTSSTVTAMVPYLNAYDGLTVITNGIKTAYLLNSYGKITTYCTGGRLREHNMSLVGMTTCQRLNEINADIAFISCRGLSLEKGVTEASEEEAQVKKTMLTAAAKTVLLCDSTKLGMVLMNRVCEIERLSTIVTDKPLPEKYKEYIQAKGIEIIFTI
jgi:DeoR/GlpR family transcriptional regulator of sugar metabolism